MNCLKNTLLLFLFFFELSTGITQTLILTYQNPDALSVCNSDTFQIQIRNVSLQTATNVSLSLNLPTGLQYEPGSIIGASEQNLSNLSAPVFSAPNIGSGAVQNLRLILSANCLAANVLDAGNLFPAVIQVQSTVGNIQTITNSIHVETGLILIESVTPQVSSAEKQDTLYRKICFTNTRIGPISQLFFEDQHLPGIEISIPGSQNTSQSAGLFQAQFPGALFAAVGDGDAFLEIGEEFCLTEKIVVTDCGTPSFINRSHIRVGWGCGPAYCRYDSISSDINIKESTRVPNLVMTPSWNPPQDYCANEAASSGFLIFNAGGGPAKNVLFRIKMVEKNAAGIDPNSLRLIGPNGTSPIQPNVVLSNNLSACNITLGSDVTVVLPFLAANDSVRLMFDYKTCGAACTDVLPTFLVEFFYQKPCPPNGFVSDNFLILPNSDYFLRQKLKLAINTCMESGKTYPFSYSVRSKRLGEAKGVLKIQMDLPNGLSLNPNCQPLLGGVLPSSIQTTPNPLQATSTVTFTYPLPLNGANDFITTQFCLNYTCDTTVFCAQDSILYIDMLGTCASACVTPFPVRSIWLPSSTSDLNCGAGACDELKLTLNQGICSSNELGGSNLDTLDNEPIFGQFSYKSDAYRLNYDFQDADDNRSLDGPAGYQNNMARHRYLAGDTMQIFTCVYVDSGQGLRYLPRSIVNGISISETQYADNDSFDIKTGKNIFTNLNLFRHILDSIRVKYADGTEKTFILPKVYSASFGSNYYELQQANAYPPVILDKIIYISTINYLRFDSLFARGLVPKPSISQGDSVFFFTNFVLDFNYTPTSTNKPDPPQVGFYTNCSISGAGFNTSSPGLNIHQQYTGFQTSWSNSAYGIRPCQTSNQLKPFSFRLRIARENFFPYEVRPLASIKEYRQTKPYSLHLKQATVKYLVLQDSVPFLTNLNLPFTENPGSIDLNFKNIFKNPIDEGFMLGTELQFYPDCRFDKPDSSIQDIKVALKPGMAHPDSLVQQKQNTLGYYANTANLKLQGNNILYLAQKDFRLDFLIRNLVVSPAPNLWVKVTSTSGLSGNFQVQQIPQLTPYPQSNGVFQLNDLGSFAIANLRLSGQSNACASDTLIILYGWNCAPVSVVDSTLCATDTFRVILLQQEPELELAIRSEPASINICTESDYYEMEIFNAKTGYAYDIQALVNLPPGLEIVPGSCQISYPLGAAYQAFANPEFVNNTYTWDISSILAVIGAQGLPGVDHAPENGLRIRFKTLATCGFVANAQPIFGAKGENLCGKPTNTLNKPANPLIVNGLNPGYGILMELSPVGSSMNYCGGTQQFRVRATLLGVPSSNDSIYVLIPASMMYVQNSYISGVNAPAGTTATSQGFRVAIPVGLSNGSMLEFLFTAQFLNNAGCSNDNLIVQSRVSTTAFCVTLGAPCTVYFATGEAVLPIQIDHPQLDILDVQVAQGSTRQITVKVHNIGNAPAPNALIQLWLDQNGDGVANTGDVFIQTGNANAPILPNGTLSIPLSDVSNALNLCKLLVVVPASENCSCTPETFKINQIQVVLASDTLCSVSPVLTGVNPMAGFQYQWTINQGSIQCPGCASSTYFPENLKPGATQTLLLSETDGNCSVNYQFSYTFGFDFGISAPNSVICKGDQISLTAFPPGATYVWSGPGIVNPANQNQVISPQQSTIYQLTLTNSNSCVVDTFISIQVLKPDTLNLPSLQTCAGVPVSILGQLTATSGIYSVKLKKANGCDSLILQQLTVLPTVNTQESRSFCKGDTLKIYDQIFTNDGGNACRTFTGANGCDSTHCVSVQAFDPPNVSDPDTLYGQILTSITLAGAPGYAYYAWQPSVNCLNCATVTVQFDTAGFYQYLLAIGDGNQCVDTVVYRILVFPPCSSKNVRIPNAFTPNGDGRNDVFRVVPHEGAEVVGSLTIYDRWGEKVYESRNKLAWDGTIRGEAAPPDVYIYIIEIVCGSSPEKLVGDVTLLR